MRINDIQIESLIVLEMTTEEKIFPQLIDLFSRQVPEVCEQMKSLDGTGRHRDVSDLAHKLKSAASNLGLIEIEEACLKIETECRKDPVFVYRQLVEEIESKTPEGLEILRVRYNSAQSEKVA